MTEPLHVVHQAGIVSIFLDRPDRRNALSLELLGRLDDILASDSLAAADMAVISGRGGMFSAGADLSDINGTLDDLAIDDAIEAVTGRIRDLPLPVIAAIDGACMGGAVDLALSCDLRIAAENAFIQVPAARLGLLYNPRSIVKLQRRYGRDAVFRLLALGERFSARTAFNIGLVSRVVPGDSHDAALAWADESSGNVGRAAAATKQLLNSVDAGDFDPEDWEKLRRDILSSPERREAVSREKKRHGI